MQGNKQNRRMHLKKERAAKHILFHGHFFSSNLGEFWSTKRALKTYDSLFTSPRRMEAQKRGYEFFEKGRVEKAGPIRD